MTRIDELKKLLQESFLSGTDKNVLYTYLDNNSDDEAFYKMCNDALITETDVRVALFVKSVQEYDTACSTLEDTYTQKKEALEKRLESELSILKKNDLLKQKKVFDSYYADLQKIQDTMKKDLQAINAQHALPFYQKAYEVA